MAKIAETPLMKQYADMKKKHPDAILLFRVGDFYETFSDDAIAASEILGITLTRRANGSASYVELAGFPHHALDTYLPRLVRAGRRVAICEQLEDPKKTKTLVKRGITELVTPGVDTSESGMARKGNNFLGGVHFARRTRGSKEAVGIAFLDITTGEFLCAEGSAEAMGKLLGDYAPREMLRQSGSRADYEAIASRLKCPVFDLEDWVYTDQAATERLLKHFNTSSLKGFGVEKMPAAIIAAGSLLHYLDLTQHVNISHITRLQRIDENDSVRLDPFTQRNLELTAPLSPEGDSLLGVLDATCSPMGSRTLASWVRRPLVNMERIYRRHDIVERFAGDPQLRELTGRILHGVGDLQRLSARICTRKGGARELIALRESLRACAALRNLLAGTGCQPLEKLAANIEPCAALAELIGKTIREDTAVNPDKGAVIADGVNPELDELRSFARHSQEQLIAIRDREIAATGITSLKINSNNVFGYYIEVRNTHRDKVPQEWIRKQTLVNAERYITPELKEYEQKINTASERIREIEMAMLEDVLTKAIEAAPDMQRDAITAGTIDALRSLAQVAADYRYVRPQIDNSLSISITDGRHPVIERHLPTGENYIANSLELDSDSAQIMMITGPNMSGKSALLRQTALICIMAQMGSFVPAKAARIGLVDKVFTRVGASDNISSGESTFMVEMNEAASILNNMGERSLILFDELGRGTSTYDGISIAWSIVEHIHENGRCKPRTLFATHYHELNEMEHSFPRIVNYNVSVKEIGGKVVFLRKLERGGSAHSFGIHVARLAGMPPSIVKRADQVLSRLESAAKEREDIENEAATNGEGKSSAKDKEVKQEKGAPKVAAPAMKGMGNADSGYQLSIFQLDDPLLSQVRDRIVDLDIDSLSPRDALATLYDLKGLVTGK